MRSIVQSLESDGATDRSVDVTIAGLPNELVLSVRNERDPIPDALALFQALFRARWVLPSSPRNGPLRLGNDIRAFPGPKSEMPQPEIHSLSIENL